MLSVNGMVVAIGGVTTDCGDDSTGPIQVCRNCGRWEWCEYLSGPVPPLLSGIIEQVAGDSFNRPEAGDFVCVEIYSTEGKAIAVEIILHSAGFVFSQFHTRHDDVVNSLNYRGTPCNES